MNKQHEMNAIDPMCGMEVKPSEATSAGLVVEYGGKSYYFCGRGCKLEFQDDPERYLHSSHTPSMHHG